MGYKTIPAGEISIILYDGGEQKLASTKEIVPDRSAAKDKQPIIELIQPTGGIAGDTITVTGSNFGNNIDELFIYIYNSESDDSTTYAEKQRIPTWRDLFLTNGIADIAKLQLFIFTIIAGFLYVYNLLGANIFQGLPDIPATLNGLLIASQSGFIGGQLGSQSMQISYIYPEEISLGKNKNQSLEIYGSGFTDGMKVIVEGCKPVLAELKSSNELNLKLPEIKLAGNKNIILIPQNGISIVLENGLQVIE